METKEGKIARLSREIAETKYMLNQVKQLRDNMVIAFYQTQLQQKQDALKEAKE